MTHTGQMRDSYGTFGMSRTIHIPCRQCGQTDQVTYQVWESNDGAFEDEKYTCSACGKVWWVDGIDS